MYKNNPNKIRPSELEAFLPIRNAKQKTEVFVKDGKLKLQIKRSDISAEELINANLERQNPKFKQSIRGKWVLTK